MDAEERERLREWDRTLVWHAFTQMAEYEPLIIERASGCKLVDIDGRELIDGVSSLWCNVHGHRHPRLDAAVREQLERVAHVTSLGQSNPTTIRLARRLLDVAPPGLAHVFFSDNGATAVEVALKMAFQYWQQRSEPRPQKTSYLAFDAAYHGDTIGSVSVGGVARFHQLFEPLLFSVVRAPAPNCYRLPPGVVVEDAGTYYLERVESLLREHHERLAAVVIEPLVQCAAGMITHPPGFLRGLRELTRRYEVLLIADEVAVGMGRTGRMWACEQEEVVPDFLCLAKGLTGGYMPLAATLTTEEVWQAFLGDYASSRTFFHGHTYGGNPLGAAVALATLEVFAEERTLDQMQPKVERLREQLRRFAEFDCVGDIRQCGLLAGIELVRDRRTKEPLPWAEKWGLRVCQQALARGVWLRPLGNVLVIMPPLSITLAELDRIMVVLEESVRCVFYP